MRRSGSMRRGPILALWAALFVGVLAACGGGDTQGGGAADAEFPDPNGDVADTQNESSSVTGGDGSTARLEVAGEVYTWTAEEMTVCEINGIFGPANADFGVPPSQGGTGPWVQFIDRGDGGINFSAVIDGVDHYGTGSGEADDVRSDGFSYAGTMTRDGEVVDVELDVTC